MPRDPDHSAIGLENDNTGGLMTGFLAEEEFDRRALWRLGSWGTASVAAFIVALLANQSSLGWQRRQVAANDLVRQSQQIQSIAKESQLETHELASAIGHQRRPRPAVLPRDRSGTRAGVGDRRDCAADRHRSTHAGRFDTCRFDARRFDANRFSNACRAD